MTPGGYILYGGGVTRAVGPEMVLAELGLPYELRPVDIAAGEHRQDWFRRLNPAGYVPALITPEGETLHEAAAIMLYLAERHGARDLAPGPTEPLRGRFLTKLFFQTNDIQPAMKRYWYARRFSTEPGDAPRIAARAKQHTFERWAVLAADLAPYVLGSRFSLADLHLALWAVYGLDATTDITDRWPAVANVVDRVLERPASGPLLARVRQRIAGFARRRGAHD